MCGRFVSVASPELLAERFGIDDVQTEDLGARYNVTPRALVYGVTAVGGTRTLEAFRWGLVPFWAKDLKIGDRMINARAETVAEKPAYRHAFAKQRCLVPATAFYEWQKLPGRRPKQPWVFRPRDGEPIAFAGLWETWRDPDDPDAEVVHSTAIVTTEANGLMRPVHDRMPVVLPEDRWDEWLDPENHDTDQLEELLVPPAADVLERYPISTRVNSPRNQGPDLLERVALPSDGEAEGGN